MPIKIQDLPRFGNPGPTPATVELVNPGSPAALMGLQSGDQIVEVNGRAATADDVPELIAKSTTPVTLTVKRGDSLVRLAATKTRVARAESQLGFTLTGGGATTFAPGTTPESQTSRLRRFLGRGGTVAGVRG